MADQLQQLQRDYRSIEAPPWLAARIQARLPRRASRRFAWLPAAAVVALALVALLLFRPAEPPQRLAGLGPAPSLAALSRVMADKPALRSPSLTQLRSYRTPALPQKPRSRAARPRGPDDRRGFLNRPTSFEEMQHG